jgi:hypothetical protein
MIGPDGRVQENRPRGQGSGQRVRHSRSGRGVTGRAGRGVRSQGRGVSFRIVAPSCSRFRARLWHWPDQDRGQDGRLQLSEHCEALWNPLGNGRSDRSGRIATMRELTPVFDPRVLRPVRWTLVFIASGRSRRLHWTPCRNWAKLPHIRARRRGQDKASPTQTGDEP